jgi:YihY family inner membrane protein
MRGRSTWDFFRDLGRAIERTDVFFMAGAITFNVLVAGIPLLLLVTGVAGFVLSARFGEVTPELMDVVLTYIPAVEGNVQLTGAVAQILDQLISDRAGFTVLGGLVLMWLSTRLVGTLRVVLRQAFQLERDRGVFRGKLFDLWVVMVGGFLVMLNVGATVGVDALEAFGVRLIGLDGRGVELLGVLTAHLLSFGSAWVLFYLVYWVVPARRVPFRAAAVGATFTAVAYELMKVGFAWFATSVVDYSNAYGSLAVVAVLFFWIYYTSTVFVLGALVARVYEVRRETMESKLRGSGGNGAGVVAGMLLMALILVPSGATAQAFAPFGGNGKNSGFLNGGEGVVLASNALDRHVSLDRPLVNHDGAYVVVHLAENRVLVMEGTEVVWSSAAGTGHGFELEGQGQEWTFTTPVGMFHVLRKEKDPLWLTPDWWYVQRGLAIPPSNQRNQVAGTLGTSAIYLGDGIAIHGTDNPELLINFIDPDDRRVSHGCIRLTNEAARELYHRVDVGTPVLIF